MKTEIMIFKWLIETTNKLSACSQFSLMSPHGHAVHTTALSEIATDLWVRDLWVQKVDVYYTCLAHTADVPVCSILVYDKDR